jgi:hypothetical protein
VSLPNPEFNETVGVWQHPEHANIRGPVGWALGWKDGEPFDGIAEGVAHRPEAEIISEWMGLEPELTPDDSFTWKVFVQNPLYASIAPAEPIPLPAGRYRLGIKVWPKIHLLDPGRPHPTDPWAAEIGLEYDGATEWRSGFNYRTYQWVVWDIEHAGGTLDFAIVFKGKYRCDNSFFFHRAELVADDDTPPLPGGSIEVELGPQTRAWIASLLGFEPGEPDPPQPPAPTDPEPPRVVAYSQNDPRWANEVYAGGTTFARAGCFVVSVAMMASLVYAENILPPEVAHRLRQAGAFDGALLSNPNRIPDAYSRLAWGGFVHWRDRPADMEFLAHEIATNGATICELKWNPSGPSPEKANQHFVVVEALDGDDALIVDPWDGQRKRLSESRYRLAGWTAARTLYGARLVRPQYDPLPQPPIGGEPTLLGINDHSGEAGPWMRANGGKLLVVPLFVGESVHALDYRAERDAGIRVIVNLRHSYAVDNGGAGTMPRPGTDTYRRFVDAARQTILNSMGVWAWEVLNEYNNPREHPQGYLLTPNDVARCYNEIVGGIGVNAAPGALDPFNAAAGEPREWLTVVHERILGAEFVAAHGYIRGPDAELVGSNARFTDWPLEWQYRNYPKCVDALLDYLPPPYRTLPVYVTEFNHLSKTFADSNYGWVDDARGGDVVRAALAAAQGKYAGLALYRWRGDEWEIHNKPHVLAAVRG